MRARPSFRFWEAGGNWLRGLGPAPAAPPLPPRGVGRADAGTLGLGSGRNALKRRRAAQHQRRPAERAPGTEERASGRAGERGAGEAGIRARSLLSQVPTSCDWAGCAPSRGAGSQREFEILGKKVGFALSLFPPGSKSPLKSKTTFTTNLLSSRRPPQLPAP